MHFILCHCRAGSKNNHIAGYVSQVYYVTFKSRPPGLAAFERTNL